MKLLVTGKNGQIVSCLRDLAGADRTVDISTIGRPEFDLADARETSRHIRDVKPDIVVSAAAYTAVDKAEDEPQLAYRINADGAAAVAKAAAEAGIPVIHLSTDYVFPGTLDRAHSETDPVGPLGVYGTTKLAGERGVSSSNPRHVILRTAWVYSVHSANFVKTMLRLANARDEISVVADQWGNPTSADDIAQAIVHIARRLTTKPDDRLFGVFHLAGTGDTNWSGFARHIFAVSAAAGGPHAAVRDIDTLQYPTKAKRPANSRLDTSKLQQVYEWRATDWRTATEKVVRRLLAGAP
jgi:dTDP-4-dehydrorhamnose reductase